MVASRRFDASKLVDRLILLPCYAVPAPQCRMEGKVMDDFFAVHPEEASLDPRKNGGYGSPQARQGRPGDIERARPGPDGSDTKPSAPTVRLSSDLMNQMRRMRTLRPMIRCAGCAGCEMIGCDARRNMMPAG